MQKQITFVATLAAILPEGLECRRYSPEHRAITLAIKSALEGLQVDVEAENPDDPPVPDSLDLFLLDYSTDIRVAPPQATED